MTSAFCPDCNRKIVLGPKPRKGLLIVCPHCNADLEIISVKPLELDWATFLDDEDEQPDFADEDLWDDEDFDPDDWDEETDDWDDWDDEDGD